jgi:hypothetical protein
LVEFLGGRIWRECQFAETVLPVFMRAVKKCQGSGDARIELNAPSVRDVSG